MMDYSSLIFRLIHVHFTNILNLEVIEFNYYIPLNSFENAGCKKKQSEIDDILCFL
jgi:hypothetical protein